MGTTRISLTYPPNIDPTRATLAYGNWAPARFKRELEDDNLRVRQLSVYALSQYLHDPQNIASIINVGAVTSLKQLLQDADVTCRKVAADCIGVMNTHAIGRQACLRYGLLKELEELLLDEDEECRLTAHHAINMLCESVEGCLGIIETKSLLPTLSRVARDDINSVKIIALQSISKSLMADVGPAHDQILSDNFLDFLKTLLEHFPAALRLAALECLTSLSFSRDAKELIDKTQKRMIPVIIEYMESDDYRCRSKAALCLANITMFAKGKKWALTFKALPYLIELAFDSVSEVRVNSLCAITRMAELPSGRQEAMKFLPRLQRLKKDPVAIVRKYADICVKVITWKP